MTNQYTENGRFSQDNPEAIRGIYFPLMNARGYKAVITPRGKGDAKLDQNSFLFPPVSEQDVINGPAARNLWVHVPGVGSWSVFAHEGDGVRDPGSESRLEAGMLWYRLIRTNRLLGLKAVADFFSPAEGGLLECAGVEISNISGEDREIVVTGAYMLYGRSADSVRDHRHVTSLLNRAWVLEDGVILRPTLSFDERGHNPNAMCYYGLAAGWYQGTRMAVDGFFADQADFTGEAGCMQFPQAVLDNTPAPAGPGDRVDGVETLAGFRFAPQSLASGQALTITMVAGLGEYPGRMENPGPAELLQEPRNLLDVQAQRRALQDTEQYWLAQIRRMRIRTGTQELDSWLAWVALQPTMRRIFGCSFMPHHDYGRGGRGWRDLWQDCLALLLTEPEQVSDLLYHNFAGVRIDGSNATIIGDKPGEFLADRNNIPRLWMDHGAWPLLTLELYLDQTGDFPFLLRRQSYFQDQHTHRCTKVSDAWSPQNGLVLKTRLGGKEHQGSVLEHVLVQHLTAYHAAGESGSLSLEGADWNDGMDMARNRGESVAFTALYGKNLISLSRLVRELERRSLAESFVLPKELQVLLRGQDGVDVPAMSPRLRRQRLEEYCDLVARGLSGDTLVMSASGIARILAEMGENLLDQVGGQEFFEQGDYSWFNGYYDDHHRRLEEPSGNPQEEPNITLTGQTFPIMAGVPGPEEVQAVVGTVRRRLWDDDLGGVRLNSDFKEVKLDMGRLFGFAYGHKENGAMFSHMAVMYAYGLYAWPDRLLSGESNGDGQGDQLYQAVRDLNREAEKVLLSIWDHTRKADLNRLYPGIPEYINQQGRGMYPYLTGSASWYMLTLLTQTLGIRGLRGDVLIRPRFTRALVDDRGVLEADIYLAGRDITLRYLVPEKDPSAADYRITRITLQGRDMEIAPDQKPGRGVTIPASLVTAADPGAESLLMEVTVQ